MADPIARAWDEYLAWTRHADPGEYVATESLAWQRLQAAILGHEHEPLVIAFEPDEDFPGSFEPG